MTGFRRFEEIKGWQRARELVREIYQVSTASGLSRDAALRDQLRRASISTMSNIAEGFARRTNRDFAHFLDMARGSCSEVQSLLYVALDVEHISQPQFDRLYESASATAALIARLTAYLRARHSETRPDSVADPEGL
jgi:four helix bundle protein